MVMSGLSSRLPAEETSSRFAALKLRARGAACRRCGSKPVYHLFDIGACAYTPDGVCPFLGSCNMDSCSCPSGGQTLAFDGCKACAKEWLESSNATVQWT
jgi:hypothetical protein